MKSRYDFIYSAITQRTLNEDIDQVVVPGIVNPDQMSLSLEEFGEIEFREQHDPEGKWEEFRLSELLDVCDELVVDFGATHDVRLTFTVVPREAR